jgi:hypothetical protein
MSHRFHASARSIWAGRLLGLVFVVAMVALGSVLVRRDTWRRETPADPARVDSSWRPSGAASASIREPEPDELTQITECLSAFRGERSSKRPLPLRREPLKRWSDPSNNVSEAAVWAWGERGRPRALVIVEHFGDGGGGSGALSWGFELVSLANEPLQVDGSDGIRLRNATRADSSKPLITGEIHWAPKGPGLAFRDLPGAPNPAQSSGDRLRQMNELIKRVSAVAYPGMRTELALLPEPIERYSDAEAGQVDGAVFFFAIGANPEVIAVIEAQGPSADKASWRCAVAPATAAQFEVAIDGKEVYSAPYHSEERNVPNGSYFIVGMPRSKP